MLLVCAFEMTADGGRRSWHSVQAAAESVLAAPVQ
jgi:hypothetical protein